MRKELGISYSKSFEETRKMDMFFPKVSNGAALLFIHGGGFRSGSRDVWHFGMEQMCQRGYVCGSCSYRFAPEYQFPSQIEDVRLAMSRMRSHASEYGFASDKIAVFGTSAGSALSGILGTIEKDDKLGWSEELVDSDTRPNAIICDSSGPLIAGVPIPDSPVLRDLMGGTYEEMPEKYRLASTYERVTKQAPPYFIVAGELDKLGLPKYSRAFAERLKTLGVPFELNVFPKLGHSFGFHQKCPLHPELYAKMDTFLKSHF